MRLRTRRQYQRIAFQSTRYVGHWIIVDFRQNKDYPSRLGITASRRYGDAVRRNRFKRIVREAFRLCRHQLKLGFDFNIKPRSSSLEASTSDIAEELLRFFG